MQVYKNGQIAHYKQLFPNVSFPASGPSDEFLTEHGAYKVNAFKEHNRATHKLIPSDPYIENGWAYTVQVADKTEEELASEISVKAAQKRAERDRLLAASDWTQVEDAPVNKQEWAAYRQSLRDLPQQEGFPDIELPTKPSQA